MSEKSSGGVNSNVISSELPASTETLVNKVLGVFVSSKIASTIPN